jgi:DNA modification methylase
MPEDIRLFNGDCLNVLPTLAAGSVDAVICDPPYGLEFMGKEWDRLGAGVEVAHEGTDPSHPFRNGCRRVRFGTNATAMQAWHQQWAAAALRVLKPGGYLLAFGGTRTFHRLACALEDAGFEMRDTLMWLHAQGFPKGKGCLKPAFEPVLLCRRPGPRVLPLGIEECRVPLVNGEVISVGHTDPGGTKHEGWARPWMQDRERVEATKKRAIDAANTSGRYPANVCHDGSPEVLEAFAAFGDRGGGYGVQGGRVTGEVLARPGRKDVGKIVGHGDSGTAARFFYCAKASRRERNAGLEGMPEQLAKKYADGEGFAGRTQLPDGTWVNTDKANRKPAANSHPCVKPLALMRWLVKLACPAGGTVLDPFMGSGTTGVACVQTGRRFVGIELDPGYFAIAEKRIAAARDAHPLFAEAP